MFCANCGKEIEGTGKYCPYCGETIESKSSQSENNENSSGNKKENRTEKNVAYTKSKKTHKGKKWLFLVLIIIVLVIIFLFLRKKSDVKETIEKLQESTTTYKTDVGYAFNFQGKWELNYTEENEFVKISESQVESCVIEAFGISDTGYDGTFSYDFDTGNLNMYFDVNVSDGNLSVLSYNLNKDEFSLNVNGESYSPSSEFEEYLNVYNLADILTSDVSYFETSLNEIGLTFEQVSDLSFDDIEKYLSDSTLDENEPHFIENQTVDNEEDVPEQEGKEEQSEYIFPDSSSRYLSEDEIRSVEAETMALGRNEIFARHGYIFSDSSIQGYFESRPWYKGTVSGEEFNADEEFNDFEKKNVELIKQIEDEVNGTDGEFIGMSGIYICTYSDVGFTGRIEIYRTGNTCDFVLNTLDLEYDLLTGSATIIDDHTIQITSYGVTITCTWSDAEHMYVTTSEIVEGTDAAVYDDTTNGRNYIYADEFN